MEPPSDVVCAGHLKHYQVAIKCIDKSQLKLEGIDIEKEVAHMREVSIISFPPAAATCRLLSPPGGPRKRRPSRPTTSR